MRLGTPMYRPASEKKRVYVTVEHLDGTTQLKLWRGWKVNGIRKAAHAAYPNCTLQFGRWF